MHRPPCLLEVLLLLVPYLGSCEHITSGGETTLTLTRPAARVRAPEGVLSKPTSLVEVPIISITNPLQIPFSISVDLEWKQSDGTLRRAPLGSFSVYPPDRPGVFALRTAEGFAALKKAESRRARDSVSVLLEMKLASTAKVPEQLQVRVGSLRWRNEPTPVTK